MADRPPRRPKRAAPSSDGRKPRAPRPGSGDQRPSGDARKPRTSRPGGASDQRPSGDTRKPRTSRPGTSDQRPPAGGRKGRAPRHDAPAEDAPIVGRPGARKTRPAYEGPSKPRTPGDVRAAARTAGPSRPDAAARHTARAPQSDATRRTPPDARSPQLDVARDPAGHGPPAEDRMVVYGRNAVREALQGPRKVARVWATVNAAKEPWLTHGDVVISDAHAIERECGSTEHQGICADVAPYRYADAATLLTVPNALIVALDEIQDPQNLGAICRTAECAGATGLVIPERRTAEVTPAVCKASAGAVEHLPIARVRNLADFLVEASRAGAWNYGADGDAPTSHTKPDYRGSVVLVLGSEGRGLRPRVAKSCDALVSLPIRGTIASLNVNAATAALLYEIVRQRSAA